MGAKPTRSTSAGGLGRRSARFSGSPAGGTTKIDSTLRGKNLQIAKLQRMLSQQTEEGQTAPVPVPGDEPMQTSSPNEPTIGTDHAESLLTSRRNPARCSRKDALVVDDDSSSNDDDTDYENFNEDGVARILLKKPAKKTTAKGNKRQKKSTEPQDNADNGKLKADLLKYKELLRCEACKMTGTLINNGSGWNGAPMAKCTDCGKKVTGNRLRDLITTHINGSNAKEPPQKKEPTLADLLKIITELKQDMQTLRTENTQLKIELMNIKAGSTPRQALVLPTTPSRARPQDVTAPQASPNTTNQAAPRPVANRPSPQNRPQASQPISWAEAVKQNIPVNRLSNRDQDRMRSTSAKLSSFRPIRRIEVEAVYFKVNRGPVGQLRNALKESLPPTALLNLSFIGQGCLEVICNKEHKDKLIFVMNKSRLPHIKEATILQPHGPRRNGSTPSAPELQKNMDLATKRLVYLISKIRPGAARAWYEQTLENLKKCSPTATANDAGQTASASEGDASVTEKETPIDEDAAMPDAETTAARPTPSAENRQ